MNRTLMPIFKPKISPTPPTIKGKMAPPTIPVTKMPEKEPWFSLNEFKARENMMGNMTDRNNPSNGKANNAMDFVPKSARAKDAMAKKEKVTSTILLSNIFKNINPRIPPAVMSPQK